jgi:2-polyprenyl-6-methoxyphenol hydroxylase-like FAD-dependent oxidoreductase
MHDPQVLIVGAGLAGLAVGRALLSRGVSAEIVDRATAFPVAGAGLYLPGNGVRAIAALGLADPLAASAVRIPHQRILNHRGRLLKTIDLQRVWGPVGPCVGIRRMDLHRILLDGATGVPIRPGITVTALTQTRESVSVQFADGRTRSYGVVIGADGIHSSIRRLVFGDIPARPVGQISWRFIADDACGVTTWTAMLARGRAFLMLPVGPDGLYCYADLLRHGVEPTLPWSDGAEKGPARTRIHERDALRALFRDFAEPVPRLLGQLDRVDAIHVGPIEEVCLERWVDRRVVLVGDAAHATSPNMAQGASMALEDALVLADALASADPPLDALAAFAGRRRARVRWVQQRTHQRDRIRNLPSWLRDLSLRLAGGAIYKADYRPLFDQP